MEGTIKTYSDLPDEVMDFLCHPDAAWFVDGLLKKYGVAEEKTPEVLALIDAIVLGQTPLLELPAKLAALGIPEEKSKQAAVELAQARLAPIAASVGDILGALTLWGGASEGGDDGSMTPDVFVALFVSDRPDAPKDSFLLNRLRLILVSFVKGIRTKPQTVEVLMRSSKVGGMDMAEPAATALVEACGERMKLAGIGSENEKQKTTNDKEMGKTTKGENPFDKILEEPAGVLPADADTEEDEKEIIVQQERVMAMPVPTVVDEPLIAMRTADAARRSFAQNTAPAAQPRVSLAVPTPAQKAVIGATVATPPSKPIPRIQAVPATPSGRPKVTDVQPSGRRLSGPVDELSRLTLTEFRRLSRDPAEAATKLSGKIAMLEEQGFEKKIAGIKAWRTSPLYQAYLALSQESMVQGVGVEEIARRKKEMGEDSLTPPELSAIMKLNAELRF